MVGDSLLGHDEKATPAEGLTLTERTATVYNLRVSDDHTFFIGDRTWGFSAWVHNTYSWRQAADGTIDILDATGAAVLSGIRIPRSAASGIRILGEGVSAIGGPKGGLYTFFHASDATGAENLVSKGLKAIGKQDGDFFGTPSLARAREFVDVVVEITIPDELFQQLWIDHLITQSHSHADALVISPVAQAIINAALGL